MDVSFLVALIGYGVNYGYRLFNGKVDRKLPVIITVISVCVVILVTVLIIPMLLLVDYGYSASFYNLSLLYSYGVESMLGDLVIAIIFTFLGISWMVKQLKMEI